MLTISISALVGPLVSTRVGAAGPRSDDVIEVVRRGEMIAFPGLWAFMPRASIILVSDQELETLAKVSEAVCIGFGEERSRSQ